jgi:hypothetical protein
MHAISIRVETSAAPAMRRNGQDRRIHGGGPQYLIAERGQRRISGESAAPSAQ